MTVTVEVPPPLGAPLDVAGDRTMSSETEVAPGTTIHRLLARLVLEQPAVGALYDPTTRRLAEGVRLAVNGRNYELVGGLTYFLADADRLSFTRE